MRNKYIKVTHISERKTREIIRLFSLDIEAKKTAELTGRTHDLKFFKKSGVHLKEDAVCLADTGCQGLVKLHGDSELPKKKSNRHPLSEEDKRRNRSHEWLEDCTRC